MFYNNEKQEEFWVGDLVELIYCFIDSEHETKSDKNTLLLILLLLLPLLIFFLLKMAVARSMYVRVMRDD